MEFVKYEEKDQTGMIIIDRPKAMNALNSQVLDELNQVLDQVDMDHTRVLVITGAGDKAFVAGADIGEMSELTKEEGEAFGKKGNDLFRRIEQFPLPVIAAVNGYALGGGNELAMSCDFRIASENAKFGQPETGLGITPGFGGTQRLSRLVGPGYAKMMIYTAKNIDAQEALRIGLVNDVVSSDQLIPETEKVAQAIAGNAPIAVRAAKKAVDEGLEEPIDDGISREETLFGSCFETEDQREGMANFLRKRGDPRKVRRVSFRNR